MRIPGMFAAAVAIGMAAIAMAATPADPSASRNADWTPLFNGKDLSGWVQKGGVAKYEVKDGTIVGTTVLETPNSFLTTEKEYDDFILELDFKVHEKLNSGVQIRSRSLPEYQKGRVHGPQVEIDASERMYCAGLYEEGRRLWLQEPADVPAVERAFKHNDWNQLRVEAIGNRIRTWLNGQPVVNYRDMGDYIPKGFIALQVHATKEPEPMTVAWRNIRIQEVDAPTTGTTGARR